MSMLAPPGYGATKCSDFTPLSRQIKAAGLLERRRGDYAFRFVITLGLFAGLWWVFDLIGNSWYQALVAVAMGIVFTQVAFLGHDAGHRQIARTRRVNDLFGLLVADLLIGLCHGWWVSEHNQHHAHPNHEGRDPDIGDSVITFTDAQSRGRRGTVETFIAAHQASLFFPLLMLEGLNLHVQAITWLNNNRGRRRWRAEVSMQVLHVVLLLGALLLVLSPVKALVFLIIQQAVWGVYMGCSFAPNHKGMPIVRADEKLDFLRAQVLTTRNVRGGRFTDLLLGGLNYQVEHHLFPSMPRANLRKAQPIVKAHCLELSLPFTETSLIGSYAIALRHLHQIGAPLRGKRRAPSLSA